jgi:hypothetical protein
MTRKLVATLTLLLVAVASAGLTDQAEARSQPKLQTFATLRINSLGCKTYDGPVPYEFRVVPDLVGNEVFSVTDTPTDGVEFEAFGPEEDYEGTLAPTTYPLETRGVTPGRSTWRPGRQTDSQGRPHQQLTIRPRTSKKQIRFDFCLDVARPL